MVFYWLMGLRLTVRASIGAVVLTACLTGAAQGGQVVLSGENNRLNAYDAATFQKHTVIRSEADDKTAGLDINAQICVVPDGVPWKPDGETWFIAGEDTEQNTVAGVIRQGWGLFRLKGNSLNELSAVEMGKLVPDSYVTTDDNPENYGCAVLPDGRLVTGDVGDQLPTGPATGQLIEWFPTADMFKGPTGPGRTDFPRVPHCKIDVGLGTSGGIAVDNGSLYIASNRPNLQSFALGGIYRYDYTLWPKGETPADGCSRQDVTGKRLAAAQAVGKSLFIPQGPFALTPSAIIATGRGTFYVSSVFTGTIAEFDRTGGFVRMVLVSAGQVGQPGVIPQLNGVTPFGMGIAGDGALWVADIGVVGTGPAAMAGSVVRLPMINGVPGSPLVIDEKLEFPDGIGIVTPRDPAPAPAPAPAMCMSRRVVTFHLPRGAKNVILRIDGKREKVKLVGRALSVSLRGRPAGSIKVRITARVKGRAYTRNSTLQTCRKKLPGVSAER